MKLAYIRLAMTCQHLHTLCKRLGFAGLAEQHAAQRDRYLDLARRASS